MLPPTNYPREDMQRQAGRNDPCPCGSGKKFKRCCLPLADERRRWEPLEDGVREFIEEFVHNEKFDEAKDRASLLFGFEKGKADLAEERLFYDWYIHDYLIPGEGKSLIRLLLEESEPTLDQEMERMLSRWASSTFSFLEVLEIKRGTGFRVRDMFRNSEYFVWDVSGSCSLSKYDILFARPYPVGSIVRMASGSFALPYRLKSQVEAFVEAGYHDFKARGGSRTIITIDDYLRSESLSIIKYLRTALANTTPAFVTSDGEILLFSSCEYTITDPALAVKLLDPCEELVDVGEENGALRYDWVTKEDSEVEMGDGDRRQRSIYNEPFILQTYLTDEESGEEMVVLGNLSLKGKKLGVSCASEKRLQSCKGLVEKLLGRLIVNCSEERYAEPPFAEGKNVEREEEIPPEVESKVAEKFFNEYYAKWLRRRLPALGNLTPVEASKTADGHRKLEEMLKLAENDMERSGGKLKPPIEKLRAALGL